MFEIYGRNNCVWCDRAKELLEDKNLDYTFKNIEENKTYLAEFKYLFIGATTVPKVVYVVNQEGADFSENTIIGGYKELYEWLKPSTNKS